MNTSQVSHKKHTNDNVAGIFNYCDRWCQHCAFTLKCSFYKNNNAESGYGEGDLWGEMEADYNEIIQPKEQPQVIISRVTYKQHPTNNYNREKARKIARKYGATLKWWLKNAEPSAALILQNKTPKQTKQFNNAIKVLSWYSMFIPLKTNCAMHEYEDDLLNQSAFIKGSAKITLIAIHRSKQALLIANNIVSQYEMDTQYFIQMLNELKSRLLITVPDAMEYVRPGLDETAG